MMVDKKELDRLLARFLLALPSADLAKVRMAFPATRDIPDDALKQKIQYLRKHAKDRAGLKK